MLREVKWVCMKLGFYLVLAKVVHQSYGNADVLRRAQRGRKPPAEQQGKCSLDRDFQCEYGPRKRGLSLDTVHGIEIANGSSTH